MQPWSDSPIHSDFCVRFFLDTNILVYLVDNTYPGLNDFIAILDESPFVELISSNYVIFEFIGVRKREHYLRIAADNSKAASGQINFSSLLKFKDDYKAPGTDFEKVVSDIQREVKGEIERISTEYNINVEYSSLHQDQLQPTYEVCLSSKLANQDCLVLVSSVLPQPQTTHDNVVFLTNDGGFVRNFTSARLDEVLTAHSILPPQLFAMNRVKVAEAGGINLTEIIEKAILEQRIKENLLALIKQKPKLIPLYLGKTFIPNNSDRFPANCICFKLVKNYRLPQNVYVTAISKDLDFIYTTKKKIESFWNNGNPVIAEYNLPQDQVNYISFLIEDTDADGTPIDRDIIEAIKADGNLIFIHPDSYV